MLYTKYRKIRKTEKTGIWGDFDTWEDFGETWGDWENKLEDYVGAWLKVLQPVKNVFKQVDWIGYEGLKKYLAELLPESFYRRWGWIKWTEIFKDRFTCQVNGIFNFTCQISDSYIWGYFDTWGDFPNDQWGPLWSIT
jgi:hypothetical protein